MEEVREKFYLNIEHYNEEDDDSDDENMLAMKYMQSGEYVDAEIDKLIETFEASGFPNGANVMIDGELIENDIRISELIRDHIDEIKRIKKRSTINVDRKEFLETYSEVADEIGVPYVVEYLLPCLVEVC